RRAHARGAGRAARLQGPRDRRSRPGRRDRGALRRARGRDENIMTTPMTGATPMTGGEALVRSLYGEGVRVVFGLPGVQLYGVMAALRDEPRIRFITTRHEQATS